MLVLGKNIITLCSKLRKYKIVKIQNCENANLGKRKNYFFFILKILNCGNKSCEIFNIVKTQNGEHTRYHDFHDLFGIEK